MMQPLAFWTQKVRGDLRHFGRNMSHWPSFKSLRNIKKSGNDYQGPITLKKH
ncbi:hypothetical protein Bhyg_17755 [Pseudolycoriella hygida]|uniref:Uncharacterized protein n=1 Tax=Pseudolycoriella hygida TaxID=35572 RepID=A0A9Q0MIH1_9DIPT|nr:hypothetical protein Bhyg_17755 [Pseudolycoriella hygida]